jgi:hypothetical protein
MAAAFAAHRDAPVVGGAGPGRELAEPSVAAWADSLCSPCQDTIHRSNAGRRGRLWPGSAGSPAGVDSARGRRRESAPTGKPGQSGVQRVGQGGQLVPVSPAAEVEHPAQRIQPGGDRLFDRCCRRGRASGASPLPPRQESSPTRRGLRHGLAPIRRSEKADAAGRRAVCRFGQWSSSSWPTRSDVASPLTKCANAVSEIWPTGANWRPLELTVGESMIRQPRHGAVTGKVATLGGQLSARHRESARLVKPVGGRGIGCWFLVT